MLLRIAPLTSSTMPIGFPSRIFTLSQPEKEAQFSPARHDFISLIVHELRAPMTSIRGYADLLLQQYLDPLTDKQHEAVQVIQSIATRMIRMTSYLLLAERLRLGRIEVTPEPVNLQALIEELIQHQTVGQAHSILAAT